MRKRLKTAWGWFYDLTCQVGLLWLSYQLIKTIYTSNLDFIPKSFGLGLLVVNIPIWMVHIWQRRLRLKLVIVKSSPVDAGTCPAKAGSGGSIPLGDAKVP
jgi:hypothetical protein